MEPGKCQKCFEEDVEEKPGGGVYKICAKCRAYNAAAHNKHIAVGKCVAGCGRDCPLRVPLVILPRWGVHGATVDVSELSTGGDPGASCFPSEAVGDDGSDGSVTVAWLDPSCSALVRDSGEASSNADKDWNWIVAASSTRGCEKTRPERSHGHEVAVLGGFGSLLRRFAEATSETAALGR
ncbi:hypothetical protein PHYPSEUDO_011660 [Phytophthora pseudosyringae]|uniref:Uncharacterized protein n=1 Tax=Phytophthora pseudosyringae TaxID=221518 RepID=A0A8T1W6E3_9STRA|nr:hypothetical protein PHYPSEUDO_011660 [Phytophthora pseudosyringae]